MTTSIFSMGYVALAIAALATWVISQIRPLAIAPFGHLLRRMMNTRVNRIAIFAVWWWVGWHFFGQPFPN